MSLINHILTKFKEYNPYHFINGYVEKMFNSKNNMSIQDLIYEVKKLLSDVELKIYQDAFNSLMNAEAEAIFINEKKYPSKLKQIDNPPFVIFVKGDFPKLDKSIAIVGSRKSGEKALKLAYDIGYELGSNDYQVISGLALGVDAKGHQGTVDSEGITIAVFATPIYKITPKSNKNLAYDILKKGCWISERTSDKAKSIRASFSYRNRITSGLSDMIIVTQSRKTGGTIRQIEYAMKQDKPVLYFVPDKTSESYNVANKIISKFPDITPFYSLEDCLEKISQHYTMENNSKSQTSQTVLDQYI